MRVKQTLPRSKGKEKLSMASNKFKMRRCAVKLRRVELNGVAPTQKTDLNQNVKRQPMKTLLPEQQTQTQKEITKVNSPKADNSKNSETQHAIISQHKIKKCIVKIKRMRFDAVGNKKCVPPLQRNPRLALTSRRAKELELKGSVELTASSSKIPNKEVAEATSNESTSPRNLANKPGIITELLLTDNDDLLKKPNADNENSASHKNTANPTKITHKFFHKENKNKEQSEKKPEKTTLTKNTNDKRKQQKNKILKTQPRRKTIAAKKDIYEFLSQSQSQTSDSDGNNKKKKEDIASDIIKKLIDEGKVVVTKNYKGRPRPIRKRNRNQKNYVKKLITKPNEQKNVEIENIFDADDHDDDERDVVNNVESEPFEEPQALSNNDRNLAHKQIQTSRTADEAHSTANSTFSELARSVLKRKVGNQAEEARKNLAAGRTALEILQRYNSTPLKPQNKSPQLQTGGVVFSPIQSVPKENTTKFLVPPSRPRELFEVSAIEEMPTTSRAAESSRNRTNETLMRSKAMSTLPELPSLVNELQKSSFSSNDSNAENQPPPKISHATSMQQNENDVIHSARQIPNPRRTLQHRSPLKAINIIDIVTLPPYTGPTSIADKANTNKKNVEDKTKLFGFEEYLDENSHSEPELENSKSNNNNNNKTKNKSSKHNISKHLRKLKRLRPKSTLSSTLHSRSTIAKNIFGDDFGKTSGNRNIKEMLCSTMISEKQQANSSNNKTYNTCASDSSEESDNERSREKKEAELFGDPETTFDPKSFHRTYERPAKRKRKLIHPLSDIFESDHEHSDDDDCDPFNTSAAKIKAPKTKRRQADCPSNEELDKFASEFNSMLKEAEDYELVVE